MFSFSPVPDYPAVDKVVAPTSYGYGTLIGTHSMTPEPPQAVVARWADPPQSIAGARYV
jgi:hypothetical protein